ncbi:LOW QUALITY PROTEIN: tripartite motif-containing protein 60 [Lycaon pictus]
MEFVTGLTHLQESSCPICLDYLKDAVTTNGHNFYRSCINMMWKDMDETFPCPVCFCFHNKSFRSNRQLCNLTEIAELLQVRRSKRKRQEEYSVCEKHNQFLTLFCGKDLEVLCTQCSFSLQHRKHYICPIKKAASFHRKILEYSIDPLKDNMEVEKVIMLQASKLVEEKEFRREEILSKFEQIRLFLQNQQEPLLKQMEDEERDILTKLAEHCTTFSGHVSTLRRLLKEVESKHMQSDLDFLTHVKGIHHRYETWNIELFLFQLMKYGFSLPPEYSGLDRILKPFQVDVILDLETALPRLVVSDRKTVIQKEKKHLCYNPRRFYLCPPVLGSRRFSSGRHYWEVEVENKPKWTLGVSDCFLQNWWNQPVVEGGFGAIGRYVESIYVMLGPKRTFLPVVNPSKVGIFVDCELGEVSFYNMNDRSLLYTCNDYFF